MRVRSTIISRSNSANTPSICIIIRPAAVEVSKGSEADRKATPAPSSSSSTLANPPVERASRSTLNTSSRS
jgi:hypothetical protein